MRAEIVGDLRSLPRTSFGVRAPLWWGVIGLVAVELTVFATLMSSFFYLRLGQPEWPPAGIAIPDWKVPVLTTAMMLLGVWTIRKATTAATRDSRMPLFFLGASLSLALAVNAIRFVELSRYEHRWFENAYTSVYWLLSGLHFTHVLVAFLTTTLVLLISRTGPLRRIDRLAIQVNGVYFQFVAWMSVPLLVLLYFVPRWI
jgi:cytochrome c oxidase subunit III